MKIQTVLAQRPGNFTAQAMEEMAQDLKAKGTIDMKGLDGTPVPCPVLDAKVENRLLVVTFETEDPHVIGILRHGTPRSV